MTDESLAYLTLSLVPGLGVRGARTLIQASGSPVAVLDLPRAQLRTYGISREAELAIASGYARQEAEKTLERAREMDIQILALPDEGYPPLLAEISDPPLVLYVRGEPELLCRDGVAIVGARRCTPYGRQLARKLAAELSGLGLSIVSGMARGIDTMSHRGALDAGGPTVAVLGNGVDIVYPRENRSLYRRIIDTGCVISEFPLGSYPAPQNFPVRNRIISGLCWGTLVPEAAEFSGSLVTARLTLEQGRELWAVPGNVTSDKSYGPNYLIKQGAAPVMVAQDVLDELPLPVLQRLHAADAPEAGGDPSAGLSDLEKKVLDLLKVETSTPFDLLLEQSGLDVSSLSSTLLELQMKRLIQTEPGRRYSRCLSGLCYR